MTSPGPLGDQGQGSQVAKEGTMKHAGGAAQVAAVASLPQSPHLVEREATTTIVFSLLSALTSSDNDARNRAEQAFNGLKENSPAALLYGLLQVSAAWVAPVRVCLPGCLRPLAMVCQAYHRSLVRRVTDSQIELQPLKTAHNSTPHCDCHTRLFSRSPTHHGAGSRAAPLCATLIMP